MAEQIIRQLIDDTNGKEAERTVPFSIDGVSYEIDLSGDNVRKLLGIFGPFIENGRRIGRTTRKAPQRTAYTDRGSRTANIRAWAVSRGIPISDRGRIPRDIQQRYDAAHDRQARHEADRETALKVLEGNPSPTEAALARQVLESPSARHSEGRRKRNRG